jgi:predicted phage baseplate assembly protein
MRARLLSQPEQVIYEPAGDGDETVSEIVEIVDVKEDRWKRTMVNPNSPLGNRYDWATVTVNGNVVRATHGKTIEGELLGAGEGLATHQSFLLKHHPLTYTSAAGDSGVESALKIEIDGVRWQEVTSFDRLDQTRRAFLLRNDEQENTAVIFGFGQRGTGVPWGAKQIRATYRQGLGQEGNVAAGCLHLLQNALPGLKAVSNPLAASGGADPETMDEAQEKAPLSVRLTERIVSFSDYEDYARQFAGIGKAEARLLSRGNQQVLHITIAGCDGNEVEEESDVYRNLAEAIDQLRASPLLQVHIASYRRVLIQLKARVWIDPAHEAHKTEIKKAVEDGLKDAFAFNRRKFAQPVVAAEISALIQSIPGVVAVELEHLHRHGQEAKLNPLLMAQAARWEEDGPQAAEMLVISPGDVIELDLETAP